MSDRRRYENTESPQPEVFRGVETVSVIGFWAPSLGPGWEEPRWMCLMARPFDDGCRSRDIHGRAASGWGCLTIRGNGWMVPVQDGDFGREPFDPRGCEHEKGVRWMPWHQEAMKDVARCEKPWGAASRL
jgi:hypothetical protein